MLSRSSWPESRRSTNWAYKQPSDTEKSVLRNFQQLSRKSMGGPPPYASAISSLAKNAAAVHRAADVAKPVDLEDVAQ